jgi:hypothetical protein
MNKKMLLMSSKLELFTVTNGRLCLLIFHRGSLSSVLPARRSLSPRLSLRRSPGDAGGCHLLSVVCRPSSLPAVVLTPVLRSSLLRRMERRVLSSIFNPQYSISKASPILFRFSLLHSGVSANLIFILPDRTSSMAILSRFRYSSPNSLSITSSSNNLAVI